MQEAANMQTQVVTTVLAVVFKRNSNWHKLTASKLKARYRTVWPCWTIASSHVSSRISSLVVERFMAAVQAQSMSHNAYL